MNLNDFLGSVRPGLQPDLPRHRELALLDGDPPENYDEEVWLEWQNL